MGSQREDSPRPQPKALLERAKAGDRNAFDGLVAPHRDRLEGLVRLRLGKRLRQRIDAEDVVQETLLKAYRSIGSFQWQSEASFFRWLSTIVENVLHDLERRHLMSQKAGAGREIRLGQPVDPGGSTDAGLEGLLQASGVSPSRALRRDERFARLERALDELSPEHREVLLLTRVQAVPVEEVARRLGKSRGAVSMLILRALRELKAAFGHTDSLSLPEKSLEPPAEMGEPPSSRKP